MISPGLAEHLASVIVNCGEDAASALVRLLHAVADPGGNKQRHEIAWVAIRAAFPFVHDYDSSIVDYCERAVIDASDIMKAEENAPQLPS